MTVGVTLVGLIPRNPGPFMVLLRRRRYSARRLRRVMQLPAAAPPHTRSPQGGDRVWGGAGELVT